LAERILLASASPRRRHLLAEVGLAFEVDPVAVDEDLSAFTDPEQAALELSTRKAQAGAARACRDFPRETLFVIGADTVVAVPDPAHDSRYRILGKPADAGEAAAMLNLLSGSRHLVVTGVCVARCPDLSGAAAFERTWVEMRPIEPHEVEAYVASGEWRDKAGGYAIQENADAFVTGLEEGGFDNVVGLPVRLTLRLLRDAGAVIADL
jgi:septum formation protein